MGDWGFRAKGTHGYFQIDSKYRNLVVKATGLATIPASPNQNLGYLTTVTIPGGLTPTSVVGTSGPYATSVVNINDSAGEVQFFSAGDPGQQFRWWVFDYPTPIVTPGWGFRVKKTGTGDLIYDSRHKPFRYLGQFNIAAPAGTHGTAYGFGVGPYTGKEVCCINMSLASYWFAGPSGGPGATTNYFYLTCLGVASATPFGVVGRFTQFGGGADIAVSQPGSVLLADVTGFA